MFTYDLFGVIMCAINKLALLLKLSTFYALQRQNKL